MSLQLKDVTLSVNGRTHLYETSLELEKGTMNVLLGPTTAGKTTIMRLMAGLDAPTSGKVYWEGKDVTGMRVQDRHIAMVYQQFINYPTMTVYDNIASPLRLMKQSKSEIDRAVRSTAEIVKMSDMLDRKPLELSGGQQQRCALARALVKGSGLVLLDEPLANLDYKLREELRAEIPKMFEESGAIFVYATTEPEEALLLGGNTATLWEGRITQFDKAPEVYHRPNNMVTARVFSDPPMNFLKLSKIGNQVFLDDGQAMVATGNLSKLKDGKYMAGFRPNHLELSASNETAMKFSALLNVIEFTGAETFLHMEHGGHNWVGLIEGTHKLGLNSILPVYLDPSHIYIFAEDGALIMPASYATAA